MSGNHFHKQPDKYEIRKKKLETNSKSENSKFKTSTRLFVSSFYEQTDCQIKPATLLSYYNSDKKARLFGGYGSEFKKSTLSPLSYFRWLNKL